LRRATGLFTIVVTIVVCGGLASGGGFEQLC
jgi:hypothetical protein